MSNTPTSSGGSNLFGSQTTAGAAQQSSGGLFGQAAQSSNSGSASPASNMFGNANTNTQAAAGSNLFGSTTANTNSPFSWNKPADKPQGESSSSGLFSTPNKPSTTTTTQAPSQGQSTSLFGNLGSNSNQASSAPSGSATPTSSKAPFSFFSTTPAGNPPSTGLFGGLGQGDNKGGSIFGASQAASSPSQPAASSNLFGAQQQQQQPQQATSSTPQASTALFGAIGASKPAAPTFTMPSDPNSQSSQTPAQEPPKQSPFSFPSSASQQQPKPAAIDSSATSKPENRLAAAPPLSFGNASGSTPSSTDQAKPNTTSSEKPNMFATASNATASPAGGIFSNLNQNQEQKKDAPASSAPPSGGLFMSTSQKPDDSKSPPSSSTNLFAGLGQKKDDGSAASAQQPTSAAATSTSATAAPTSTGLFGSQNKTEQPASSTQPTASTVATATAPATTPATLGSSTSGPAPTAQSRLKNKSMDEIITRWSSDLAKYQKEFQVQAEKVAEWDRMLLENGNTLAQLYSRAFQAERDSAEVEKQISAVESQQDELSMWLDRYEAEVEEMMARQVGQGEGLQGPDQERERTYKAAERVSEKLDNMGKELTSMIEEINDASTAISKTSKPDDPLSQIVRVLNGHLSQLQLIDQGTAALQAKVTAAQQQSQRLGSRLHGGYNEAADSFSRSYLGKG